MVLPLTIHQIWVGGPLPALFERFARGWRQRHPAWDYRLWTSPDELVLRNGHLLDRPEEHVPARNVGQFVSDVMRYEILERFGGVYLDCDVQSRKPIDELLVAGVECFAAWETQGVWIGNAVLGAQPGALFLRRLIEELPASVERHRGKRPNVSTGPQLLTAMYRGREDELAVFDQDLFYPYRYDQLYRSGGEFPDAYAVHHWNNKAGLVKR